MSDQEEVFYFKAISPSTETYLGRLKEVENEALLLRKQSLEQRERCELFVKYQLERFDIFIRQKLLIPENLKNNEFNSIFSIKIANKCDAIYRSKNIAELLYDKLCEILKTSTDKLIIYSFKTYYNDTYGYNYNITVGPEPNNVLKKIWYRLYSYKNTNLTT